MNWKSVISDNQLSQDAKIKKVRQQVKLIDDKVSKKLSNYEMALPEPIKKHMNIHTSKVKSLSHLNPNFDRTERFQPDNLKHVSEIKRQSVLVEEDSDEVNALLLDAIRAKLALLTSINKWKSWALIW